MEFAGQGKRISAIQLTKLIIKKFVSFSFLLFLEFQQYQYRNTKNDVRLVSFSLFFFLYLNNTNTEFCISHHLAKKLYTVHIKSINSNFNNIQPKDSTFQGCNCFVENIGSKENEIRENKILAQIFAKRGFGRTRERATVNTNWSDQREHSVLLKINCVQHSSFIKL